MPTKRPTLAAALLDAQVAWILTQFDSGVEQFAAEQVDRLLEVAGLVQVGQLGTPDAVQATARELLGAAAQSQALRVLAVDVAMRGRTMPDNTRTTPADLVDRDHVEELVDAVLSLHRLHERALDRIAASPLVGVAASSFVTQLVTDVLSQNTDLARKVPGMSSLLALGGSAVGRVRGLADRQLDGMLGDAVGKGGEFAVRRLNAAVLGVLRTGPILGAAMESWDLQAGEPIADIARHLGATEVRRLAEAGHAVAADLAGTAYAGAVLDASVEIFFEHYARAPVADLLEDFGLTRAVLVELVTRHVRQVLDGLRASGELEPLVRAWLAPFYASPAVRAILAPHARAASAKT